MKRVRVLTLVLILAVGLMSLQLGCIGSPDQCVCTAHRASVQFTAVDGSGAPEGGVAVSVLLLRTGTVLDVRQPSIQSGVVTVVDDSHKAQFSDSGDVVRVSGSKDTRAFTADFVVGVDGDCACHVMKLAGPSVVTLE
jgi:hypothetical protein